MIAILSQSRKNIVNMDTVERIFSDGATICAQTLGGRVIEIGKYESHENREKVMNYIGFCLSTAAKEKGRTVLMPSENVVNNDKDIVAKFLKSSRGKDNVDTTSGLPPEIKVLIEQIFGGDAQ